MMSVRPVRRADVAAVIELVRGTLTEFGIVFGEGAKTDEELNQLPDSYTSHGGGFFVATNGDAVVGTAGYERNGFIRDDSQVRASRCSRGYRRDLLPS